MTVTEKFNLMSNPFLKAIVDEAGAFRVLNDAGEPIRTFSVDRAAKLRKDPNYCSGQLFHSLPRERGEVGLKFLAEGVISKDASLLPHREAILAAIWDALPPCQHAVDYDASIFGGHPGDYPVPAAGPNSLKREHKGAGFKGLLAGLREKGEGQ